MGPPPTTAWGVLRREFGGLFYAWGLGCVSRLGLGLGSGHLSWSRSHVGALDPNFGVPPPPVFPPGEQMVQLIMEYVPLGSLRDFLPRHHVGLPRILLFAQQICEVGVSLSHPKKRSYCPPPPLKRPHPHFSTPKTAPFPSFHPKNGPIPIFPPQKWPHSHLSAPKTTPFPSFHPKNGPIPIFPPQKRPHSHLSTPKMAPFPSFHPKNGPIPIFSSPKWSQPQFPSPIFPPQKWSRPHLPFAENGPSPIFLPYKCLCAPFVSL